MVLTLPDVYFTALAWCLHYQILTLLPWHGANITIFFTLQPWHGANITIFMHYSLVWFLHYQMCTLLPWHGAYITRFLHYCLGMVLTLPYVLHYSPGMVLTLPYSYITPLSGANIIRFVYFTLAWC